VLVGGARHTILLQLVDVMTHACALYDDECKIAVEHDPFFLPSQMGAATIQQTHTIGGSNAILCIAVKECSTSGLRLVGMRLVFLRGAERSALVSGRQRSWRKRRSPRVEAQARAQADAVRGALEGVAASFKEQPLTSTGFTAAVLLLVAVSGGVVYLSYSELQERRVERKALDELERDPPPGLNDQPTSSRPPPATSKGFGSSKPTGQRPSVDEEDLRR